MTENKKNIGLLLRDFNIIGGIERVATTLSNELSHHYNVFVIAYSDKNRLFDYSGELIVLDGKKSSFSFLSLLPRFFRKVLKLRGIIREKRIDSIISFGENPNILNLTAVSKNKSILTIHSFKSKEETERNDLRGIFNKIMIRFLYNRCDRIVTVSRSVKDDLVENFKLDSSKIVSIYNPFDTVSIRALSEEPLPAELEKNEGDQILVTVGRICSTKALWHLVRAFADVKKEITGIKLYIIGEAYLPEEIAVKNKLISLILDLGVKEDVVFIDYTRNPYNILKNSDIFVSSSILEGFGNVIVESMICGLPVIFPDCKAGPREIIAPGTGKAHITGSNEFAEYGILTPVCDGRFREASEPLTQSEILLSKAVSGLLKDSGMRKLYSEKGLKRAQDFDSKKIIKQYIEILEKA